MSSIHKTEKDFPGQPCPPNESRELLTIKTLNHFLLQFNLTTDAKGIFVLGSKDFLEYLGYSGTENETTSLFSIIHPADKIHLERFFEQVQQKRVIQKVHFRLSHNNGQWHHFAANFMIQQNDPLLIDFLVRDVTVERTEKQNLIQSLQQFKKMIENSRDILFQVDVVNQKLAFVSPSVIHLTGCEPAEMETISLEELIRLFVHPADQIFLNDNLNPSLADAEKYLSRNKSYVFRVRHRSGKIARVECQFFPIRNSQSQIVNLQGIIRDITRTEQLKYVLDESQENYRNIVENTQSLFAILDRTGTFKFASGQWKKFLGYFPEDLAQSDITELIHPDDQEAVAQLIQKLAQSPGNVLEIKYRLVAENGEISWQLANLASQVNKQNEVEKIYFISNDITRLVKAKQALNHRFVYEKMLSQISKDALAETDSRSFIESSLNKLGIGTEVDRVYLFINMNDGKRARLEYEWISDQCSPLLGNVFDYSILPLWKNRLVANEPIHFTNATEDIKSFFPGGLVPENGACAILIVPLMIKNRFYGFIGFEVTKEERDWLPEDVELIRMAAHIFEIRLEKDIEANHRQLVEKQLFESEKKYRQIVTDVPTGILHLSTSGSILDANPYALNIFNVENIDELHHTQIDGHFSDTGNNDLISNIILLVHRENPLKNYEIKTHRSDGKPIILQISASIQQDSGQTSIINAVLEDVTEHRLLEQQLLQAQKMESIGMLAGGIAHDFNNLLGGIIGYASLILNEITPESNSLYWDIESILNISNRASELTNQLMAFSRTNRFQTKPTQVNWIIDEVVTLLSRTIDKAIDIKKETEKDLKFVMADSGQLQQAILNICINARDAISEKGVIQIVSKNVNLGTDFVENHLNAIPGPHVLISIVDNGCGMDEGTRNRIFEPFFTTKERTGGTGLGLAMTYGIIKNHQGYVDVDSKPGEGTVFNIYLPVAEDIITSIVEENRKKDFTGVETILVIDDEEIIRNISKRILERVGYKVITVGDGNESIKFYRKKHAEIDLVLLDLVMPKMSGVAVFNELVKINPNVKVLVSSGYAEDIHVKELKSKGVEYFIQKPFQSDDLLREIKNCLKDKN